MPKLLRDPLLHFLVIGACLFAASALLNEEDPQVSSQTIVVDREGLLTFMQYRSKAFDQARFGAVLEEMPADLVQRLTDEYVREEALYREGKALKLDQDDYVSRRRLVRQVEYVARGLVESNIELSEKDLQDYLDKNQESYFVPQRVTFTHVFLDAEKNGVKKAEQLAMPQLQVLNSKQIEFHQAPAYGDHFLYHRNYVEKEADEIASHFGESLQARVFSLEPDTSIWQGPFRSQYGYHLVMVAANTPGYLPSLADIRGRVEQDTLRARLDIEYGDVVQDIVTSYDVRIDASLR